MAQFTSEQFRASFGKLPEDVREAVLSVEIADAIQRIGKEHGLLIDKQGILAREASYVMVGLVSSGDFISHLKSELGVTDATAQAIANKVNEAVFIPIRKKLTETLEAEREAREEAEQEEEVEEDLDTTATSTDGEEVGEESHEYLDKSAVLDEIENPIPVKPVFERASEAKPIVDQKLEVPIRSQVIRETITPPAPQKSQSESNAPRNYTVDPYREPAN